jgi:3-oxoacyl-[acyl-carrier protein] reductase
MTQKVALVTGASRGIGAATALALGQAGYKIAVHYKGSEDKARALVERLPEGSMPFKFDLAADGACQELIKVVKDEMGSIDVLVNNAGISIDQLLAFAKPEDFDTLIATNLKPVFLLSKAVAKVMIRQKGGRIVNISSVVGHLGNAGQSMYATTKAAMTGFTKSVAVELAGFGILVNCVAPGFIETDMTGALKDEQKAALLQHVPLKRLGRPEEVAAAVVFLAGPGASYITGTTLHVNGGMYRS